jgi:hypothetical protein
MAKKPSGRVPPPPPVDANLDLEGLEDVQDFLDEIGPNVSICEIFEMKINGSRPHVDRVEFATFREDPYGYLRNLGAPAKYLIQFKDSGRSFKKHKIMEVSAAKNGGSPPVSLGATTPVADSTVALLREQNAQYMTMISQLIASQKGPDVGTLLAGLGALMPKTDNVILQTLLPLLVDKKPDVLGQVRNVMEIAREFGGGSDKESGSWGDVLKEAIPPLIQLIPRPGLAPAMMPAGDPGAMAPQVISIPAGGSAAENGGAMNGTPDLAAQVHETLAYLKPKIYAEVLPFQFAFEWIKTNAADPQWRPLIDLARAEGLAGFIKYDPELDKEPYKSWFTNLIGWINNPPPAEEDEEESA